ncbi:3-deoxy-D-manno-octulosonic acid transferase [Nymphon striatum]|nr:3-deoxy-D-manno-octulosonic acid transferase [Nymphon striatum]
MTQRLHLVFGGELIDPTKNAFKDVDDIHIVGMFPNYASAYDAWKSEAQKTVDNAHMRYFIAHIHRLRDEKNRGLDRRARKLDQVTARHLTNLGAPEDRVRVNGSLKESSGALPHDEDERQEISSALETRPVWLAASTHPGEDEIVAQAHRNARRASPRLLLIIAPRHPERGPEIAQILREDGWRVALRSEGTQPDAVIDIYIADTLGEMGLWYRVAPINFLGGSLVDIGGHNPFEPAALGSAIIHGPHIANAQDVYERLDEAGAARLVEDAGTLGDALIELLEPHKSAAMAHAAWEIGSQGAHASEVAFAEIGSALDRLWEKP